MSVSLLAMGRASDSSLILEDTSGMITLTFLPGRCESGSGVHYAQARMPSPLAWFSLWPKPEQSSASHHADSVSYPPAHPAPERRSKR